MKALIIIDVQNDFLPGGPLAVPHGDAVVPVINQLEGQFRLVVATQDWHPAHHSSFAASHPGRKPGEVVRLRRGPQVLWPVHCVQNTPGAALAPNLVKARINRVFKKGTDPDIDSYSGFFDNDHLTATGLGEYLQDKKVTEVYVCGLATDYCVKFTALDAVDLEFKAFLVEDACRGVNLKPDDSAAAIAEMKLAGVVVVPSQEILGWLVRGGGPIKTAG